MPANAVLVLVALVALLAPMTPPGTAQADYIVELTPPAAQDAGQFARVVAFDHRIRPTHVYGHALVGFSARLSDHQVRALSGDPRVAMITPDEVVSAALSPAGQPAAAAMGEVVAPSSTEQFVNEALQRIGLQAYAPDNIDGVDERHDVDIAVLDSGITPYSDLNVGGGHNCSTTNRADWLDRFDHGTAVAAIAAALDNDHGIVGVAPGARVWGVKVISDTNRTSRAMVICGLDWVAAQRDPVDSTRPLFEVVNMSLNAGSRSYPVEDNDCGRTIDDTIHQAVCRVTAKGIVVVAAAGNDSMNTARLIPSGYKEVVTVAALADFDGQPGGLGLQQNVCPTAPLEAGDDVFTSFSNFGTPVDFVAPGKCLWLPRPSGVYARRSGTSFASPVVAGAFALYRAHRPSATAADARAALTAAGSYDWFTGTSPDGRTHRLLNLAELEPAPSFSFALSPSSVYIRAAGGTYRSSIELQRQNGHSAAVSFSTVDVPAGFSASISGTTLTITAPSGLAHGAQLALGVRATDGRLTVSRTLSLTVDGQLPTAAFSSIGFAVGSSAGLSTAPVSAVLAGADDSGSFQLRLQRSINDGSWTAVALNGSTGAAVAVPLGAQVRFRVRAIDPAGNASAWVSSGRLRVSAVDSAQLASTGSWQTRADSEAIGGSVAGATGPTSTAGTTALAAAMAVIVRAAPDRGEIVVGWDGTEQLVETYSAMARPRLVVVDRRWASNDSRPIVVAPLGTDGRPLVEIDAILVLRRI